MTTGCLLSKTGKWEFPHHVHNTNKSIACSRNDVKGTNSRKEPGEIGIKLDKLDTL